MSDEGFDKGLGFYILGNYYVVCMTIIGEEHIIFRTKQLDEAETFLKDICGDKEKIKSHIEDIDLPLTDYIEKYYGDEDIIFFEVGSRKGCVNLLYPIGIFVSVLALIERYKK